MQFGRINKKILEGIEQINLLLISPLITNGILVLVSEIRG